LHYFEDGGSTYHGRFRTWDFIRGQEYDPWKAMVAPPLERLRQKFAAKQYDFDAGWKRLQHAINCEFMQDEEDFCLPRCFASGFEFLDLNRTADNWFLMLECFDPHEPFSAPERFKEPYRTGWKGGILDWPMYEKVNDSPLEIAEIRANYAALVAACDHYFGQLLDYFDRHDMWKDTALALSTDHGFLLAEHDWWGKNLMPYYSEISHIPCIVHHPQYTRFAGQRRSAVTQTMDLMPTFLESFGLPVPDEVQAKSLLPLLASDNVTHDVAIFGMFGGPIGATDGRYAYYLYPEDLYGPGLHEYTLMPMHLSSLFSGSEMKTAKLAPPFDFTKDMPVLRIDALKDARRIPMHDNKRFDPHVGTTLYDLAADPAQLKPFRDPLIERRFLHGIAPCWPPTMRRPSSTRDMASSGMRMLRNAIISQWKTRRISPRSLPGWPLRWHSCSAPRRSAATSARWARSPTSSRSANGGGCGCGCWRSRWRSSAPVRCRRRATSISGSRCTSART
jgi:hypothetical protein